MIDNLFNAFSEALMGNIYLALLGSFGWGVLSILLSPCHLSSIPLIIGYISSRGINTVKSSLLVSLVFTSGIFLTIAVIGLITASLGRLIGDVGAFTNFIIAGVFFVIGLYLLDIIKLDWNKIPLTETKAKGLGAAFLLGLIFGIGVGPCTFAYMAPVLGVVFETAQTNVFTASLLLAAFGIGHCSLIVLAGVFTGKVQSYLNWSDSNKTITWIKRMCGVLVILGGVYQVYNAILTF